MFNDARIAAALSVTDMDELIIEAYRVALEMFNAIVPLVLMI